MKPYSLLLVSLRKPDQLDGIICSNHMLAWGLWRDFSALPHVSLSYHDSETPFDDGAEPLADFILIHAYFDNFVFRHLDRLHSRIRQRVMQFCELPVPLGWTDHQFTFLPAELDDTECVPFPCLMDVLTASQRSKTAGSILLDHIWLPFRNEQRDWCPRLYEWLRPLVAHRQIGQLGRSNHDADYVFPPWIGRIPEQSYPGYLHETAKYETFILTHPGSYEHSIVDMVARGINVLVPRMDGMTFAPRPVVEGLGLTTFSSEAELLEILAQPADEAILQDRIAKCTDMPEIVRRIDAYCQGVLE